jgi:hypothetical protein
MEMLYPAIGHVVNTAFRRIITLVAAFIFLSQTTFSQTIFSEIAISDANIFLLDGTVKPGSNAVDPATVLNNPRLQSAKPKDPVNNSLPLSLENFTATLNNKKIVLDWETTMELNTSHFTVQRSTDGIHFEDDAIVIAEGTSAVLRTYSYGETIPMANNGILYYRLKMVDVNAGYRYSEVAVVRLANDQFQTGILVFPNPAVNQVRVTVPADWQNKTVSYSIYNTSGSLVRQQVGVGEQTATIQVADLPAGLYVIRSSNGNQGVAGKFIKTN